MHPATASPMAVLLDLAHKGAATAHRNLRLNRLFVVYWSVYVLTGAVNFYAQFWLGCLEFPLGCAFVWWHCRCCRKERHRRNLYRALVFDLHAVQAAHNASQLWLHLDQLDARFEELRRA